MMSKKAKEQKKLEKTKKIKKVLIIIVVALLVCGVMIFSTIQIARKVSKSKNLSIGYFDLPQNISSSITNVINECWEGEIDFSEVSLKDLDSKKLNKKYDLIFSWDGKLADNLKIYAKPIDKKCFNVQPSSFRKKDNESLNILLNHFEIAYNKDQLHNKNMNYPETYSEFMQFLSLMEKQVFCPFICEGSNDNVLISFIGSMIESFTGTEGYRNFISKLQKTDDFDILLDETIASSDITLRTVLDELRSWPEKGYTHPAWMQATNSDINLFMEENQVAVVYTSLTEHRKMAYKNVEKYEACRFPILNTNVNHGVVAPAVVCTKINTRFDLDKLIFYLVSPDAQESLSLQTELAPVSSRGQAYDRQADDVRFFAAACSDGPLPDLYTAVYQLNPSAAHEISEKIRTYLK